jgi:hypothetical protein
VIASSGGRACAMGITLKTAMALSLAIPLAPLVRANEALA